MVNEIDDYQQRTNSTAIYPEANTGSLLALSYVGLGLGEAGEVQGKIKKVLRDSSGHVTGSAREDIIDELGDVCWYVARLAAELGEPLSAVFTRNLEKLESRKERGVLKGSGDNR